MNKVFFAIIGVFVFAVGAGAQARIGNTRWQLTELNGKKLTNSRIYIEFNESESRANGNAGCNRYFGSYELSGNAFKMQGVGSTRMACMRPGVMETEQEFLKALGDSTRLRKSGNNLVLFAGSSRVLRFKSGGAQPEPSESADLTSKKWILRAIGGKGIDLTKDAPFLNFDATKRSAGGNSGCNVFGGNYEANGSTIKFREIVSTMRACEFEDRMTIERGFLGGLENADRFEIRGNRLILYKGTETLLEFDGMAK